MNDSAMATTGSGLPSTKSLFKEAWGLFRERKGTYLGIYFVPILVAYLVLMIGFGGAAALLFAGDNSPGLSSIIGSGGIGLIGLVAFILVATWGQLALLYAIKDRSEKIGFGEAFRRAGKKIGAYWWLAILSSLVVAGGFVLFIIPGIILALSFSFAAYVLVDENVGGMAALIRSREYVWVKGWAVIGRILLVGLIIIIVDMILTFLVGLITDSEAISQLVESIFSLFISPVLLIFVYRLFEEAKALRGTIAETPNKGRTLYTVLACLGPIVMILGPILFSMVLFKSLGGAKDKAMDAKQRSDFSQIQIALELFKETKGGYPKALSELSPDTLPDIPTNTTTKQDYVYTQASDGQDYQLCPSLTSTEDDCVGPIDLDEANPDAEVTTEPTAAATATP